MKAVIVSGIVGNVTQMIDDYFLNSEHTNEEAAEIIKDIIGECSNRLESCENYIYINEEN